MQVRFRSLALFAAVLLAVLVIPFKRTAAHADEASPTLTPVVSEAVAFAVSPAITDLPAEEEPPPVDPEAPEQEMEKRLEFRPPVVDGFVGLMDPAVFPGSPDGPAMGSMFSNARLPITASMPPATVSFAGLATSDNGNTVVPPDTVGDVGPSHYVQMVNNRFRVWDKAGNPLIAARTLASIFAPLGANDRCSSVNDGDPVVLYDPLADRWFLSQFCVSVANPNNHMLIAISQTSDPTGAYFLYDFMMPNNKFNDYPHFGVWPDAYYMTDHQFNQAGTAYLGEGTYAYDRLKMLAGDPTAKFIYFDLFPLDPDIGGMLASDVDGLNPPPIGSPAYFMNWRADEYGDPFDQIQIFAFHADFHDPAASTFTQLPESHMPVPAFDPRVPPGTPGNVIEQPGAAAGAFLDAIQDRFMHRLAYRNFGGQESLVVTHTVNVGPDPSTAAGHQSAVRYYELRRSLPGGSFALNNVATFAPDSNNRWMGSAAQDNQGNIAIGYSVSSTTVSPSIRYAGRLASDPPNGLFQGETTLIAGTGRQNSSSGRWGDYSAMSIDPSDDCSFWYTQEYYNSTSNVNWLTRVGSFKFPSCTSAPKGTLSGTITDCATGLPIAGAQVQATGGYVRSTGAPGTFSMTTVPGTYALSASRAGYAPGSSSGLVVTNGAATPASLCLVPVSVVASGGALAPAAEGCGPADGGLDPGETVTVNLPLRNTGAADTTDLVATLLADGGVLSPGGPQSYGALVAGGPAVVRPFSFTVDPALTCGGALTVTLSLNDGGTDLGTVSYHVTLGEFFHEGFDATALGSLPAGWTDSSVGASAPAAWAATNVVGYFVSAPNGAFVGSSAAVSERRLDSPVFNLPALPTRLSFKNNFSLQTGGDGGVLEISVNGGAFADIVAAGGSFVSGGYNGTINTTTSSPIGGRAAWTGANTAGSNGFIASIVNLPAAALGQPIKLRWRAAFNSATSTTGGGWRIDDVSLSTSTCCGVQVAAAPPAAVTVESCGPANNAVDPDETVTVVFPLANSGTQPTTDLVATLLPGGGVFAPSGPQDYGVLAPGGPAVNRSFSFVPAGVCGGSIGATLALQDDGVDLGTRTFTLTLGGTTVVFFENFDGVAAPALPAGWVATRPVGTSPALWATSTTTTSRVTPPNGAVTAGSGTTADNRLDSPVFSIPAATSAQLSFDNNWSLEDGFDGGVLEISVNGGPFTDILAAGGSFVSGGYSGFISLEAAGPLAGRQAWTGSGIFGSNGFVKTAINLPAAALGAGVQLRFRAAFDASGNPSGAGWRIDDVLVTTISCCQQACALTCPTDIVDDNAAGVCGRSESFAATGLSGSCGTVATAPASGSFFGVGTTHVVSTATSASGAGTTATCAFDVTIHDAQDPVIQCPADIVTSTDHGLCSAVVAFAAPTASDNCGATASTDIASGSTFPKGTTTVHGTAMDPSGRTAHCSFTVTVNDDEPPTIACPAPIVASTDPGVCSAVVTYPAPTAGDNCPGVGADTDVASGSTFAKGTTTVHAVATDTSGHTATCSFGVTVDDTEPPVLTVTLQPALLWPPNHQMTNVTANAVATDNCAAGPIILSSVTSNEADDSQGNGDGNTVNDIQGAVPGTPDFGFALRSERAGAGQGRVYTATYTVSDSSGNSVAAFGTAFVPHDQSGVVDPVSLTVVHSGAAAALSWTPVPGADFYSVVRGNVKDLSEQATFIDLGGVACLTGQTLQTSQTDSEVPPVGEAFFYLVAYHRGQDSTYGSPFASKPRVAATSCP